jgi:hypothetical protein
MARFDISLTGDKDLQRMLAEMTDKLERKVLTQAFRRVGRVVQQDAMQRIPVRKAQFRQGISARHRRRLERVALRFARLRNNVVLKPLKRSRRRVGTGVWTGTRAQLGRTDKYYYPAHLEWGHGGPYGSPRRTRPRPYLRPAITNQALMGLLTSEIAAGIERVAPDKDVGADVSGI